MIDELLEQIRRRPIFTWGTVTSVNPVRVTLDGDTAELPIALDALVDPASLSVGDRVRCEWAGRRVVIVGRAGGTAHVDHIRRSFNPTWANLTLGTGGASTGYWSRAGAMTSLYARAVLGSGFAVGSVQLHLPFSIEDATGPLLAGQVMVRRPSTGVYRSGVVRIASKTAVSLMMPDFTGQYGELVPFSSSVPWTYAASDEISVTLFGLVDA